MKISNIFNNTNIYIKNTKNNEKLDKPKNNNDNFAVSEQARDFQSTLKAIHKSKDVREQKVNDIINKMNNENYNISTETLADKLISKL